MKTEVMLRAEAQCPSHSRSDIAIRDLEFSIDEPLERGGTNAGPTPTDTALAALIGCTNVIGHKCADSLGIDIGHLEISAKCTFDRRGVTLEEEIDIPFRKIELSVTSHGGATQEDLERVAAEVKKFCPLSKLFTAAGTEIEEIWQPAR
ncbi:OsmC family protein [Nitratireductor sp. XY-223]|uniref:OsmC family protein n=1 Tax=Nitratireductor sp. XY-223 TaxID=2561926 RepID=UPI00197F16DE|nr:OsmC family protein [Nitratireductor sp. XY-223]